MILDSRIKEGKRPLTCIDVEQAREFEGKQCLFSDSYNNFVDIGKYAKNTQYIANLSIEENPKHEEYVFINNYDGYRYRLALPLEWIDQKPGNKIDFVKYTLDTWQQEFEPGDVITFRGKVGTERAGSRYKCIYAGWRQDLLQDAIVFLGLWGFTFKELFELYEIHRGDGPRDWEPFGRKVETIDLNAINEG